MKALKILSIVLVLVLVGGLAVGCAKKAVAPKTTTQEVTVAKGNVSVSITTTGTMDYADYENLSFGADGTVGSVNVAVGDLVKKDQVLASLDADAWNTQMTNLTNAIQTAQISQTTAQSNLAKAQRTVTAAQLTLSQGQLDVQTAQFNLGNQTDVKAAQDAVDTAQANLEAAQAGLIAAQARGDATVGQIIIYIGVATPSPGNPLGTGLQAMLAQAKKNLQQVLSTTSTTLTTTAALQIQNAQLQLQLKQNALITDQAAIDDANTAVANAQISLTNATQAVKDAQTALDDAKAASIVIKAPFDGAITSVSIQPGVGLSVSSSGIVKKGATAMVIADTSKFEANMLVNEIDIPNVSIGMNATVTASALPGQTFPARVTAVSPIATSSSGVVNYAVTATVIPVTIPTGATSPTTLPGGAVQSGTTTPSTTPGTVVPPTSTTVPPTTTRPTTSGTTTPRTFIGGNGTGPGNGTGGGAGGFVRPGGAAGAATVQLRQGLSLTVNLIEQQKIGVLVVPNQAVKTANGASTVIVKNSDGTSKTVTITTGLKDYQNTEITGGLNAGDIVLITRTVTAATTTSNQGGFGGGGAIRLP